MKGFRASVQRENRLRTGGAVFDVIESFVPFVASMMILCLYLLFLCLCIRLHTGLHSHVLTFLCVCVFCSLSLSLSVFVISAPLSKQKHIFVHSCIDTHSHKT